jgi:hypothetical protein
MERKALANGVDVPAKPCCVCCALRNQINHRVVMQSVRQRTCASGLTCCASAGEHAEERTQRKALTDEVETLKSRVQTEVAAHTHAVQQYITEMEHRSQLQGQLADERAAKEHAVFLQQAAEKCNRELQV